jgi:hypothetical protein
MVFVAGSSWNIVTDGHGLVTLLLPSALGVVDNIFNCTPLYDTCMYIYYMETVLPEQQSLAVSYSDFKIRNYMYAKNEIVIS